MATTFRLPSGAVVDGNGAQLQDAYPEDFDTKARAALEEAGYSSLAAAQAASDEELSQVEGVGPKTIKAIRAE